MEVFHTFKIKIERQNLVHKAEKASEHIQIKIKMPKPSQQPPVSSKSPNQKLKVMDVLYTFKMKIESQNLDHCCIKGQWPYRNQDQGAKPQSGTSSILQNSEWGLKGHICSWHLQNKDSQNLDHVCIKDQWPYPNQDQDAKPWSGTSSFLQSPKWGLKRHGCSLHLQIQDRDPKTPIWEKLNKIWASLSQSETN